MLLLFDCVLFLFSFVLLTVVVNLGCIVLIVDVLCCCMFTMLTLVVSIVAASHGF